MNKKQPLLQKFIAFNRQKRMANEKKKTLLAVSGGIDSVVMCHLFSVAKFPFAIAHCNFQLRGEEAKEDENFVKELAEKYKAEFFIKRFDTKQYADTQKISIQLAARELRYQWFEDLRKEKQFNLIATAHQLNDSIETILYNLTKGSGIRGLRGIPTRHGNIIRPLLFASREMVEAYSKENRLSFREDSSNAEDKYTRNKIRHHIIPLLKEINPSLEKTFADKIELFTEVETIYEKKNRKAAKQLFLKRGGNIYIPILKLKKTKNAGTVLFEYLKNYGFNSEQTEDILAAVDAEPGKQFLSPIVRIIKDRQFFILSELAHADLSIHIVQEGDTELCLGDKKLSFADWQSSISANKNAAFLDKEKLEFPLIIRPWKQGDYFYPFGMKRKKKKLKKFFTDEKIPLSEKEKIRVVESNKKIVWVIGYRMDERFKVNEHTIKIFKMSV